MRMFFILFFAVALVLLVGCGTIQRKLLFFPSHHDRDNGLTVWKINDRVIGYARRAINAENVWLVLHGNAGQAADRAYVIPSFSARDSVFIMEYPGYGARKGTPSRDSFDASAAEAYQVLRQEFPDTHVCVMGESIGTGPACGLARHAQPPDKIVLVVPFDTLKSVATDHYPAFFVNLILGASWDNLQSLSTYKGPVEIFGAEEDRVIPIVHAKALANSFPSARFHSIQGGHNDWSVGGRVSIRNP